MPAYLVRHAHAGSRGSWPGDDLQRPLSTTGRAQTEHLTELLRRQRTGPIVSSPARRCVETVEPLAALTGTEVHHCAALLEGAEPDEAVSLLLELAPLDGVLCSHGDLIPKMLSRLVARGMRAGDPLISQKGSMWVIDVDGGRPVAGRYEPPG
ncbi:SixA phosphatase family protein [Rhabdothermincola sp.]|uniref:SixA phosphatase family protein n=1 Tax=Rhabdothermincola sp. TaxID=2820405 RepID=UPI002FE1C851